MLPRAGRRRLVVVALKKLALRSALCHNLSWESCS